MGDSDENYQENIRYSFLLGCALKNDDIEQFFQVYDAIVPKDLPSDKVELIKEEARKIAELPDGQFNELAFKAKELSLARGSNMEDQMNAIESVSHAVASNKLTIDRVMRTSRHMALSASSENADDSGVFDVSRTLAESDKQLDSSDDVENGRAGYFDYFPRRSAKVVDSLRIEREDEERKIRRNHGLKVDNEQYDEVYKADSDSSGTPRSGDMCTPRSDTSLEGTELDTFSVHKGESYEDDEVDLNNVNVHDRLYGHLKAYAPMHQDDDDDFEFNEETTSAENVNFNFRSQKTYRHHPELCDYQERDIDLAIESRKCEGKQPLNSSDHKSYGTNIQVTKYSPPLGNPLNMDMVNRSIDHLIGNSKKKTTIDNLPDLAEVAHETETLTKKKKKKKAASKDEASSSESSESSSKTSKGHASYDLHQHPDVNGNPISVPGNRSPFTSKFPKDLDALDQLSGSIMAGPRNPSSSSDREQKDKMAKIRKGQVAREKKDNKHVQKEYVVDGDQSKYNIDAIVQIFEDTNKKKKKPLKDQVNENKKSKKDKKSTDYQNSLLKKDDRTSSETGSETYDDVASNEASDSSVKETSVPKPKQEKNYKTVANAKKETIKVENAKNKANSTVAANNPSNKDESIKMPAVISSANHSDDSFFYAETFVPPKSPVEEEFQEVVGKKKKKVVQKDPVPQPPFPNFFKEFTYNHVEKPQPRHVKPPRSVTPPPKPVAEPALPEPGDLSPSAFPALGTRDGRRNSAGDVPRNCLPLQQQDDSDLESVKSLPTDSSASRVDQFKSQISYAQMAAAPKPNAQALAQPAMISTLSSERRHSFDSLEKKDSAYEESELKTRSQELPTLDSTDDDSNSASERVVRVISLNDSEPGISPPVASEFERSSSKEQLLLSEPCYSNETGIVNPSSSSLSTVDSDKSFAVYASSSSSLSTIDSAIQIAASRTNALSSGPPMAPRSSSSNKSNSKSSRKQQKYLVFLDGTDEKQPPEFEFSFVYDDRLEGITPKESVTPKNGLVAPVNFATVYGPGSQAGQLGDDSGLMFKQPSLLATDRGNFNLEEIVGHLTREWNQVQDMLRKRPGTVIVYQDGA